MEQNKETIPSEQDIAQGLKAIYDNTNMDPSHRILLYAGYVWAACRMNAWCFNVPERKLLQAFSAHQKDLSSFFIIGKCLDYVAEHADFRYPFLLSDSLGMIWIAEYLPMEGTEESSVLFVFGPMFTSAISPLAIAENLERLNYSQSIREKLEHVLDDVPILFNSMIEQYARMLHFALTGEPCEPGHFLLQRAKMPVSPDQHEASFEQLSRHHTPLDRLLAEEAQLLSLVREGRLDEKLLSSLRSRSDVESYAEGHPLRSIKDELIILCNKYTLTAEQAGLPPRISRTLQLRYVRLIEKCRSHTELTHVEHSMTEDYISHVHQLRESPELSREILIAEEFIRANVLQPISIEDVARHVGYSGYYLSRKFAKETGLKFSEYLNRERIRYAQSLLRGTEYSIQQISDMLHFSSTSYFGRVFKELTGQSPMAYRQGKEA